MKQTLKLVRATNLYKQLNLKSKYASHEHLYALLVDRNYHWDSKQKMWLHGGTPDPASAAIKIRVMTDKNKVETVAYEVSVALSDRFTLLEISDLCPCRPPKQNDARIYLTFIPQIKDLSPKPLSTDIVRRPPADGAVLGGKNG